MLLSPSLSLSLSLSRQQWKFCVVLRTYAAKTNHLDMQLGVMNEFITAAAFQMCSYLQLLLVLVYLKK
jgi:hypothetical protein